MRPGKSEGSSATVGVRWGYTMHEHSRDLRRISPLAGLLDAAPNHFSLGLRRLLPIARLPVR